MGVNIPLESKVRITNIVAAPWNSCIKYLGIRLTPCNQLPCWI